MTDLVDEYRAVDGFHLEFNNYNSMSHSILIDKLVKYELDKWTLRWINSYLR